MTIYHDTAAAAFFGTPSARKAGRNPQWPYVPVLIDSEGRQSQILGVAYATRAEAVAAAEQAITTSRSELAQKLACPRYRALREQYGLAREIDRDGHSCRCCERA